MVARWAASQMRRLPEANESVGRPVATVRTGQERPLDRRGMWNARHAKFTAMASSMYKVSGKTVYIAQQGETHAASSARRQSSQKAPWTTFHCVHRTGGIR